MPYEHVMRRASAAAVLAAILLASGCGDSNSNDSDNNPMGNAPSPVVATAVEQAQQNDTPVAQRIVAADNTFGLALLNVLNQVATSNVASISETYYAAEIGDLSGAPDNVNAWVASETNGLITQILPPANYSLVDAVLANAIYFKGSWTTAFNPNLTTTAPFTLADGTEVSCQMMNQTDSFPYLSGADFQAVELPYGKTGRLSMLIILPAVGVNLSSFVANMTNQELSTWITDLEPTQVSIGLPRFTANYSSSLVSALTSLGMGVAFNANAADFADLASGVGVHISDVEHEAVVQVDESGTVAAAATTVTVGISAVVQSVGMTMNRPFFYAILDGNTGVLLFIGTLIDPIQSSS